MVADVDMGQLGDHVEGQRRVVVKSGSNAEVRIKSGARCGDPAPFIKNCSTTPPSPQSASISHENSTVWEKVPDKRIRG
jgi:hypothetical protein